MILPAEPFAILDICHYSDFLLIQEAFACRNVCLFGHFPFVVEKCTYIRLFRARCWHISSQNVLKTP